MAKKAAADKVALLSEQMLRALDSLRERGDGSYPPTLRELAELSGGPHPDDQAVKAAGKKGFSTRAVVTEKVDKKPSLDAPVYFKEDVPDPLDVLASRMLLVLGAQKRLGEDAYPPALRRLAELSGVKASDVRVPKAAARAVMTAKAVVVGGSDKTPSLDAPVVLLEDVESGLDPVLPALLRFALTPPLPKPKAKLTETDAFPRKDLPGRFIKTLKQPFEAALSAGIERETLPPDVAWVMVKNEPYLFLVEKLRPKAPPRPAPSNGQAAPTLVVTERPEDTTPRPTRDFAEAFRAAFDRIDRRNPSPNFVKLVDLRRGLAEFDREAFDAGLRQLVNDEEFSVDSHEGLHGPLTPEEREAGIRDSGSLLVYASRRQH